MAGISMWLLAANLSSLHTMLLMMIPPVIGIAFCIASMAEKHKAIAEQYRSSAALAMFLVLVNTIAYVRGGDKSVYIANDRLYVVGGKEYIPLYISLTVISLICALLGLLRWGKFYMRALTKESRSVQKKPAYDFICLISVCVVPIVRTVIDTANGRASLKFLLLVIVMTAMFAMLGYVLGISAGNIRYMRYLDADRRTAGSPPQGN